MTGYYASIMPDNPVRNRAGIAIEMIRPIFCKVILVYGKFLLVESGILGFEIRNPSSTNKESEIQYLDFEIYDVPNPESNTFLDSLEWCELCGYNLSNPTEKVYFLPQ